MAGLSGSLSIALSALAVSQQEIATTSNNVANAQTPGYSRQRPVTAAGDPVVFGSVTFGTGVLLQKIQSLRDPILEIQLNQETQTQSKLDASLTQLQQMQTQFASSDSGVGADISNFFKSLQTLSPDPSNLNLRQSVLTAAGTMASDFNNTANSLQSQRSNLDLNVEQAVGQVNTLTAQIASVGAQISNLQNVHLDASPLVDTQTALIRQLSGLIDVTVIPTDQGATLATANGTTLVSGSHSYALTAKLGLDNVQHVMAGTEDITSSLAGGSLAGMIQVRDVEIPSVQASLDALATGLATNLNAANAMGTDLESPTVQNGPAIQGGDIFSGTNAATLKVTMTDPAKIAASSDGSAGSNGNLVNFANVATTAINGRTPIDTYSSIVFQVGNDTSNTSADADASTAILQQLQDQRGSISGVSLDEEAANLIQYQAAYQAAARIVSTVSSLMSDAVNLGLGAPVQ